MHTPCFGVSRLITIKQKSDKPSAGQTVGMPPGWLNISQNLLNAVYIIPSVIAGNPLNSLTIIIVYLN